MGSRVTGKAPVVRRFPMIAGVDAAATVSLVASGLEAGRQGAGQRLGLRRDPPWRLCRKGAGQGRLADRAARGPTSRDAMAIGTAGYTAMLCVMALERDGITPAAVPSSSPGQRAGSVRLRSRCSPSLATSDASTGRPAEAEYLKGLGAAEVIARADLTGRCARSPRSAGPRGVDSVGSTTLANVLSMTRYGGVVAACGLAGGMDLPTTVAPFILRAVSSSRNRVRRWRRLHCASGVGASRKELDRHKLAQMTAGN